MFLAFLANLNLKPMEAQYLDTFYKMLTKFKNEDVHYILTEEYLEEYEDVGANCLINYKDIDFDKLNKTVFPVPGIQRTELPLAYKLKQYNTEFNSQIFQQLKYDVPTLPVEAIIAWVNNTTLKAYSDRTGIPLIHNELGALRPGLWKDSIYLDFSGVNSNTEFEMRFNNFKKIASSLSLLSHEELLDLVALDNKVVFGIYNNRGKSDKIGLALQVERDSNLLMYNNNWTTIDLVNSAYLQCGRDNLLIKNHPHATMQHGGDFEFAESSRELLERSKMIITINSSMGFEAMLLGKEAGILGRNPFASLQNLVDYELLLALNFAVVSYLVPANLLFNKEYYKFRIDCKDEKELYINGLDNWKNYDKIII
jgi:hypothetical protein